MTIQPQMKKNLRIYYILYSRIAQRGFKKNCKRLNKNPEEQEKIKRYWLIAGINNIDQYYIDLSSQGQGRIYSIDREGDSRYFARNFVDFLQRFVESFENRQKNEESKESLE